MIDAIAEQIKLRLEELGLFQAVEQTVTRSIVQTPPGAAFFLAVDKEKVNEPAKRELGWDIMLTVSALGVGKGQVSAGSVVDGVRKGFLTWRPFTTGGVMPAKVPIIKLEGIENTLLVYSVRVTMEVMPDIIDKEA